MRDGGEPSVCVCVKLIIEAQISFYLDSKFSIIITFDLDKFNQSICIWGCGDVDNYVKPLNNKAKLSTQFSTQKYDFVDNYDYE